MFQGRSVPLEFRTLRSISLGLLMAALATTIMFAQEIVPSPAKKVIVSPVVPRDSQGETVYEVQGEQQQDLPVVAGVLLPPIPVKLPEPKYPKSLRKSHSSSDVGVEGVITASGDFIDAKVIDQSDPEASANALAAVSRYKFTPATLDGKRVAVLIHVVVKFRFK